MKGKDNVDAKMDSVELEREKGRERRRSATGTESHCPRAKWKNLASTIIDAPGTLDNRFYLFAQID